MKNLNTIRTSILLILFTVLTNAHALYEVDSHADTYYDIRWLNKDNMIIEKRYHPNKPIWIYNVRNNIFTRYPYKHDLETIIISPSGNKFLMSNLGYNQYTLIELYSGWQYIKLKYLKKVKIKNWFTVDYRLTENEKDALFNGTQLLFWLNDRELYIGQRLHYTTKNGKYFNFTGCKIYNIETTQWNKISPCETLYAAHGFNQYFRGYSPYSNSLLFQEWMGTGICEYKIKRWKLGQESKPSKLHKAILCGQGNGMSKTSLNHYSKDITVLADFNIKKFNDSTDRKPSKHKITMYELDIETMTVKWLASKLHPTTIANPRIRGEIAWLEKKKICFGQIGQMKQNTCYSIPVVPHSNK